MKLNNKQVNFLNKHKVAILATCDTGGEPRCIFIEMNLVFFDKIIITDNEMKVSRKNILTNPQVFILAFNKDYSYCLKISGLAEYHTNTPYFDSVCGMEENKNYKPKGAIVITPDKIVEIGKLV